MIERNILQTWKSKVSLPENFDYWRGTVKRLNPQFSHYFWDDADNREFVKNHYPWFLATYDGYPAEIYRVDAVRYFWLYHFGGVYIDLDSECLRPLDDLCRAHDGVVLGRMGNDPEFVHSIPNAVMMSARRQQFWLYVMHLLMVPTSTRTNPEDLTGPIILKAAVDAYTARDRDPRVTEAIATVQALMPKQLWPEGGVTSVQILPSHYFYPIDWSNPVHQAYFRKRIITNGRRLSSAQATQLFPESYLATYWAHSWDYPQS
ncbi:glycosyltransferase family 32 protein [Bradyrhizobium sp.]|uniref:glycosyltransferase family 32 protein n=1 Tax=Bradyrhizobium sp. TaxID=376 RepID=UPI0039E69981